MLFLALAWPFCLALPTRCEFTLGHRGTPSEIRHLAAVWRSYYTCLVAKTAHPLHVSCQRVNSIESTS